MTLKSTNVFALKHDYSSKSLLMKSITNDEDAKKIHKDGSDKVNESSESRGVEIIF